MLEHKKWISIQLLRMTVCFYKLFQKHFKEGFEEHYRFGTFCLNDNSVIWVSFILCFVNVYG